MRKGWAWGALLVIGWVLCVVLLQVGLRHLPPELIGMSGPCPSGPMSDDTSDCSLERWFRAAVLALWLSTVLMLVAAIILRVGPLLAFAVALGALVGFAAGGLLSSTMDMRPSYRALSGPLGVLLGIIGGLLVYRAYDTRAGNAA